MRLIRRGACLLCGAQSSRPYTPVSLIQRQLHISEPQHHGEKKRVRDLNVLFFGTDDFSLTALKYLHNDFKSSARNRSVGGLEVVCSKSIATRGGKKREVISPVRQFAVDSEPGITIHEWDEVKNSTPDGFDVGVVASFGHMIPTAIINSFTHAAINLHPSVLPRWRGSSPIAHTVLSGDHTTGVSIITVSPDRFDVGRILSQSSSYPVNDRETTVTLTNTLSHVAAQMLMTVLGDLSKFMSESVRQTSTGVTVASKMTRDMAVVDWDKHTVVNIDRKYRALSHAMSLESVWGGVQIKLEGMAEPEHVTKLQSIVQTEPVGTGHCVFDSRSGVLCIKCQDGWVGFNHLTLKFKKRLTAKQFYNGFLSGGRPSKFGWNYDDRC